MTDAHEAGPGDIVRELPVNTPNYINHIALVLDASASMWSHQSELIKVADAEIRHLARRSRELDQETRVTVYTFNDDVKCVIYDKDVLRLPSIAPFYEARGNTALIAATMKSQDDLEQSAQLYGDHAFLTYVLTDGEENASRYHPMFGAGRAAGAYNVPLSYLVTPELTQSLAQRLAQRLDRQQENWTVACLVPDQRGVFEAKKFGFPPNNIAVWDTTSGEGVAEVFDTTIRSATETFMVNRSRGIRGSKTLFTGGVDAVNTAKVRASRGFRPLDKSAYRLIQVVDVPESTQIRTFVEHATARDYRPGSAFYELTKPEKIQPQKEILVRNRRSGRIYRGADARGLLSLPDHEVRVKPEHNPEFQIFVQSTSVNRKLVPGTKLLVLN